MGAVIKAVNVCTSYKTGFGLRNISFEIEQGSFVCITGPNGGGKSTLAKVLNGLVPLTDGALEVCNLNAGDENNLYEIRKKLGLVFQNPDNQIVSVVVKEDVAFGPCNLGLPLEEVEKRTADALSLVGMSEYASSSVTSLSGGQKQLVSLAGILAFRPRIMVLDEITSMIDPDERKVILGILKDLVKRGITVLFITHRLEECLAGDRLLYIEDGRLVADGRPDEVLKAVIGTEPGREEDA